MSGLFDQITNYSPPLLTAGQVNYKGTWSAAANSPTLVDPPAATSKGDYYVVSAAGTQFGITFAVGDWIISNGTVWEKVDLTDAVSSVFGRTGAVVGASTDYSSVGLTNTAIGASSPSTGAFTTVTASSTIAATGAVTGSNLSGTNTGDQTITLTGGVTGSGTGSFAATVVTNANLTGAITSIGNATSLGSFSSANLSAALTDETGSGAAVFATSPTLVTPILGTPSSGTLSSCTGLPISTGVSGLGTGIATALAVNTGSAGAPVLFNGALGTPTSGTVTNLTGTASININGTVGATTANTGAFTTLSTSGNMGIGTSVPSASAGYTTLQIDNATNGGVINLAKAGTVAAQIYSVGIDATISTIQAGSTLTINPYTANIFQIAGSEKGRFSSTGLAVTGVSSATSTGGGAGFSIVRTGGAPSTFTMLNSGGEIIHEYNAVGYGFNISTARVASISSTGLAVTGALSSTTGANFATSSGNVGIGTSSFAGSAKLQVAGGRSYFGSNSSLFAICAAYNDTRAQAGQGYYLGSTDSATPDLAFSNTDGTERVRITYAGNVGIGTTSPQVSFQVNGIIRAATANDAGVLSLGESTGGTSVNVGIWRGLSNSLSGGNVLNLGGYAGIQFSTGAAVIGSQTSRMLLSDTGLAVTGTVSATSSGGVPVILSGTSSPSVMLGGSSASEPAIRFEAGPIVGVVLANQSAYTSIKATAFTVSSDSRFKLNPRPITNSGTLIDAMLPKLYDTDTTKPMHGNGKANLMGFFAQELFAVYPQAVAKGDDGEEITQEWGIDYAQLVPVLVAELQSLRARLAALESK